MRIVSMMSLFFFVLLLFPQGRLMAEEPSPLDEIRKAIEEAGAEWTADLTPYTNLSWEEKQHLCGTILEVPEGPWYEPGANRDVPPQLDWRNYLGYDWTTAVRDQGSCGSCWAFGACAAFESRYGIVRNDPTIRLDLSEQFMVSCSPGSCAGYSVSGTMQFLEDTGTTDEGCFRYAASDLPCENACVDWEDRIEKIADWSYVRRDSEDIMEALQNGPLTAAFTVYDDFFSYTGGVYEHVWGENPGGHMVAIYGYDSEHDPPYWICKNSWGPSWGMQGWFYIAWGECGIEDAITTFSLDVKNLVRGTITDTATGDSLAGVRIQIVETGQSTFTGPQGSYLIGSLSDTATVIASHFRYSADTSDVLALSDTVTVFDASLPLLETSSLGGLVLDTDNDTGVQSRVILMMNGAPLDSVYSDLGTGYYEFPALPVSNPPYTEYTGFEVNALIPYPASTCDEETLLLEPGKMLVHVIELSPAKILLVDDDEGDEYENYFLPEVAGCGVSYYHFDVHAEDTSAADFLGLFPPTTLVLWFTGDAAESTITLEEEGRLREFLDAGGNLFLTGQNIAEDLSARGSTFLSEVLHLTYVDTTDCRFAMQREGDLLGDSLSTIVTMGSQGASNQTSRDCLLPLDAIAHECLFYATSPVDTIGAGTAAVWVEDGVSGRPRVLFFGFGFEAILSGNPSSMTRDEVLARALCLFDMMPVGIEEEGDMLLTTPLPKAFALAQNYPNPFNPRTTIRFDIPGEEAEKVSVALEIFNLRGQRVRCLMDGEREPGTYSVTWDGRDENGETAGSGVFFYRVTAGKFSSVRKMVLLK
jgi:hypothetical protein